MRSLSLFVSLSRSPWSFWKPSRAQSRGASTVQFVLVLSSLSSYPTFCARQQMTGVRLERSKAKHDSCDDMSDGACLMCQSQVVQGDVMRQAGVLLCHGQRV